MKVLIACEYSGTVRNAFSALGHHAVSCDILPSDTEGLHYQGDVLDILCKDWDLLIAHPPCQYLSFAGMRYWTDSTWGAHKRSKSFPSIALAMASQWSEYICERSLITS